MSQTPHRRSSRIQQRDRSATPATSADTNGEGGRRGRQRLPNVIGVPSQAYGGRNRIAVDKLLQANGGNAGFGLALDQRRLPTTIFEATDVVAMGVETSKVDITSNSIEVSKSFGVEHEAGLTGRLLQNTAAPSLPQVLRRTSEQPLKAQVAAAASPQPLLPPVETPTRRSEGPRRRRAADRAQPPSTASSDSNPGWPRVFPRALTRSLVDMLVAGTSVLALLCLGAVLAALAFGPAPPPNELAELRANASSWHYLSRSVASRLTGAPQLAGKLFSRLSTLEQELSLFEQSQAVQDQMIEQLRLELPDYIVMQRDGTTGEWQITDSFWSALESRVTQLRQDITSGRRDLSWEVFLKTNKAHFDALVESSITERTDVSIQRALKNADYVSRDEFAGIFHERLSEFDGRLHRQLQESVDSAAATALRVTSDYVEQLPLEQLNTIAQINIVRNLEITLKTVNFFTTSFGTLVNPFQTSPSLKRDWTFLQWAYRSLLFLPGPRPPIAALMPWTEHGDCWCAAPNSGQPAISGKAQIGVEMQYYIYPTRMTVEHMPKQGVLDPFAAPKWVELWVEVRDPVKRETLTRTRAILTGADPFGDSNLDDGRDGVSPVLTSRCSSPAPGDHFVCVGKWMYSIHATNHIQTFSLDTDMKALNIPVIKTVVRVTENWGQQWTCIYRLRLHGDLAEADWP